MKTKHTSSGPQRLAWFIGLWFSGVTSLGAASLGLRLLMKAAGLGA
jgi:hypothetical protein